MRKFYSRLAKKEEARSVRRTIIYGTLTILFSVGLLFIGIPTLAKISVLLLDIRKSNSVPDKTDTIPPAPPEFNSLPDATNSSSLSISGYAEPGSTVIVFQNDSQVKTALTSKDGNFLVNDITLSEGKNEFYAVAQDESGNKSQPSEKVVIYLNSKPPELTVDQPQDGSVFNGDKNKKITVSGKTNPDVALTLNDHVIVLNNEGSFSYLYTLNDGENSLKIVATDQAGNKTEKEIKVTFNP